MTKPDKAGEAMSDEVNKQEVIAEGENRVHEMSVRLNHAPEHAKTMRLLSRCITALKEPDSQQARKARLWDAFCSNQRIRVLGSAELGKQGYQHMGFEIWTMYGTPEDNYDFTDETKNSLEMLETYLDAWIATPPTDESQEDK